MTGSPSDRAVLVITSGANRVNEARIAERLDRAAGGPVVEVA